MFETITLAHVLLTALVAVATAVVSLFTAVLAKIWNEIKTLRDVRHEDRDMITKTDAHIQILEMNLESMTRQMVELKQDVERRLNAHKTLLKELAKRDIRTDD